MEKQIQIEQKKQIELAAESLAQILIQQVSYKKYGATNNEIENKYGKSNK